MTLALHLLANYVFAAPTPTLCQAADSGQVLVEAVGDGKTTARTQLVLGNRTSQPVRVVLEKNTVLQGADRQSLMVLAERTIDIAPRNVARATLPTMCVGKRAAPPAEAQAYAYKPVPCAQVAEATAALKCQETAKRLLKEERFSPLPIPPALAAHTVAQLAFWHRQGDLSKDDLRQSVLAQMGLSEANLEPNQKKEVDQGVDNLWQAVDLTLKESK